MVAKQTSETFLINLNARLKPLETASIQLANLNAISPKDGCN